MSNLNLPEAIDWGAAGLEAYAEVGLFIKDAKLDEISNHCKHRLCYLATPYTNLVTGDEGQFDNMASLNCAARAGRWAHLFAVMGLTAISPVIQASEMLMADYTSEALDPLDTKFWETWCFPLLRQSEVVVVPPILGWDLSHGIWFEVRHALASGKKVVTIFHGEGG